MLYLYLLFTLAAYILTPADREQLLLAHNTARSDFCLRPYIWNMDAEYMATNYSRKCVLQHNRNAFKKGFGENIFAASHRGRPYFPYYVKRWVDEGDNWNCETSVCCSGGTGHFTQVVWNTTQSVGCGMTVCDIEYNGKMWTMDLLICNYWPGGNHRKQPVSEKQCKCGEDKLIDVYKSIYIE